MQTERAHHPPGGLCPIHCVAWYGNVGSLRLLMKTGEVIIDYQDMYGNTALHYATFQGHTEFVNVCIEEFNANLLLVNNGEQSVLGIINDAKLALVPDDDWTSEMATSKAPPNVALKCEEGFEEDEAAFGNDEVELSELHERCGTCEDCGEPDTGYCKCTSEETEKKPDAALHLALRLRG